MNTPARRGMHSIPRLIVINWLLGMAAGILCATIVLGVDLIGLRTLMSRASDPWIAFILLYGGFAFTFGGLVSATSIMTIKGDDEG
jgi:hypothetical protein